MINEDGARKIAEDFLKQLAPGFAFRFFPTKTRRPNDWSMVFERITAEGNVMDGPIVVLVHKETGRARTLEQAMNEGWRG